MLVQIERLSKKYGSKLVLDNINLTINPNEIIGLVGPNGSGKTTLLNLLMGFIKPTAGLIDFKYLHETAAAVSRKGFFGDISVRNNLLLFAGLEGLKSSEVDRVIELFLIDFSRIEFRKLSAGMKQKVTLAQAFMGKHKLILLDEPTNHLDIDSILLLRTLINNLKQTGTSFLITSHILTDLERTCDLIVFLKKGKILKSYTVNELVANHNNLEDAYSALMTNTQ